MSLFTSPRATLTSASLLLMLAAPMTARGLAAPLAVQSEPELRAANEALRTRVADLELEIKAARARIAELEKQLAEASARLAAAGGGGAGGGALPPRVEPASTIDESTAPASPRALLRALQGEYTSAMGPVGGWGTPRERTIYFRALEKWILSSNRVHRAAVHWTVRFLEVASVGDKRTDLRVVALDPGTGTELGEPFLITAQPNLLRRLEGGGHLQPGATFELRGTLIPEIKVNVDRETAGPFDQPRFIGPFAEFGFSVDPQSMTPVQLELPPAPAAPPTRGSGAPGAAPPSAPPPPSGPSGP
jgi:hypothetical protein